MSPRALLRRQHRLQLLQPLAAGRLFASRLVRGQRLAGPAQVVLGELGQEARRLAVDGCARAPPAAAERQVQALLRAGDADVEEPPLFVDVTARDRLAVRQQTLLQTRPGTRAGIRVLSPRAASTAAPRPCARSSCPSSIVISAIICVSSRRPFRSASPFAESQPTKSRTLFQRASACLRSQLAARKSSYPIAATSSSSSRAAGSRAAR